MNYVEQMQTQSKEVATKTIIDVLNSKAIDSLAEYNSNKSVSQITTKE